MTKQLNHFNQNLMKAITVAALVAILLTIILLATGCATVYEVSRCDSAGICSSAKVKSRREFEQVVVDYDRTDGAFHFEAGKVTTGISPIEQAAAQTILALPAIISQGLINPEPPE